jgi:hypothetical protein
MTIDCQLERPVPPASFARSLTAGLGDAILPSQTPLGETIWTKKEDSARTASCENQEGTSNPVFNPLSSNSSERFLGFSNPVLLPQRWFPNCSHVVKKVSLCADREKKAEDH